MKNDPDLICFSHLRWNFVVQRPHHLMSSCSNERRVFFFEEPVIEQGAPKLAVREAAPNLYVVTPRLRPGQDRAQGQRNALRELCDRHDIEMPISWFYTPLALEFSRDMLSALTVYDCMHELSAFRAAAPQLQQLERELLARSDLVFAGGKSLFEAKRLLNPNVYLFPSSVDLAHFARARAEAHDPDDQARIPQPRLGFFGVIDERIDLGLIQAVATAQPEWQLVMLGPVVKIDQELLPRRPNIHYLGQKHYEQLPSYLSGWQVALMPFALNEATRFISPTKTLEYLAGGVPVVSTPIADVVSTYSEGGLVRIAGDVTSFIRAVEQTLREGGLGQKLAQVDGFIADTSWAGTWSTMSKLIDETLATIESKVA